MKAAEISIRPKFDLMKQNDIVTFYHMQMPRWLFLHSKYMAISLEAKVAYTFLLNRFQLSKMNGWVNSDNEVFVIFTRESLADEMGISYKKAIACFKELVAASLIWEQRLGRGNANQIYLASVELSEEDASKTDTAPFSRPAQTAHQGDMQNDIENSADSVFLPNQDLPNLQDKTSENGTSRTSQMEHLDMPKRHPNKYTVPKGMDRNRNVMRLKNLMSRWNKNVKTYTASLMNGQEQRCNSNKTLLNGHARNVKILK